MPLELGEEPGVCSAMGGSWSGCWELQVVGKGIWILFGVSQGAWDDLEWRGGLFTFVVGAELWRGDGKILGFGRTRDKEDTA